MPRFERPKTSTTADFGEGDTAAAWGLDDDIADAAPQDTQYEGYYPMAPSRPNMNSPVNEGDNSSHLPLIGWDALSNGRAPQVDKYYQDKIDKGLIKPEEN